MFWLQLVVIVALLAAVGWLAIGGGGHMSEPQPDRPDLALPGTGLLARTDVDRVRFSVGARGYRMDEVDDVLDRLAHEIELREDRIAELEGHPRRPAPEPAGEGVSTEVLGDAQVAAAPEAAAEYGSDEAAAVQLDAVEHTGENGDNAG
ncbi:MAG: DivIVA domain-containing protein [Actinocrinis sp.]